MAIQVLKRAICGVSVAVAISACGGGSGSSGNGLAAKPPDVIVQKANQAIAQASTVHVVGSITNHGVPLALDLSLVSGKGGSGQLSVQGLGLRVITVGQEVFIKGSAAFLTRFSGAAAARRYAGQWLKAPATGQFAPIALLTNMQELFSRVILSHGPLTKAGTATVNGQRVVAVRDSRQGATLYFAASGPPYPVEEVQAGPAGGRIVFDRINQPVSLTPPAHFRDLPQPR